MFKPTARERKYLMDNYNYEYVEIQRDIRVQLLNAGHSNGTAWTI